MQRNCTFSRPAPRPLCHPQRVTEAIRGLNDGGGKKIFKSERKIEEAGGRGAEEDCQCQHDVEGKELWLTGTVLQSVLPTSRQPEKRTGWDTSSRRVNCCFPLHLDLSWKEVHPSLPFAQKQDFELDYEQGHPCPRG